MLKESLREIPKDHVYVIVKNKANMKSVRKPALNIKNVLQAFDRTKVNASEGTIGKMRAAKQHVTMFNAGDASGVCPVCVVTLSIPEDKRTCHELSYFNTVSQVASFKISFTVLYLPVPNLLILCLSVGSAASSRAQPVSFPVTRDCFRR